MENNNQIIEALGKVPGLVAAAEKFLEAFEEFKKMLAERELHADIPEKEVNKVTSATAQIVSKTRCAMPDITQLARLIADNVISIIKLVIKEETEQGVKAVMKDTPAIVKHEHSYFPTYEMAKIADKKLKQRFWIMFAITMVVICGSSINAYHYFHSPEFFGKEYREIYRSKFTTDEERKMLAEDVYDTGFLPGEYTKAPELVKAKIKRNKEIIKQRAMEARANKGKYSATVPLER